MRTLAMLAISALPLVLGLPAQAQVYKCQEDGKTVFSDTPCRNAVPMNVKPASGEYNPVDGMRAQSRAQSDLAELMRLDSERAAARRAGAIDSELSTRSASDRCAQIRKDKAEALYWAGEFRHPDNIRREQEKAKFLEGREFFECK